MKKLFLTSDGLSNQDIVDKFLILLPEGDKDVKVLFIPTASRSDNEMFYVRKSEQELINAGIAKKNIFWLDADNLSAAGDFNQYDVVYVCGGNTFYLMKKLKETGLGEKIIDLINAGKIYVGVSAGSIVAGPDISIASSGDEKDVDLDDMRGLGLTQVVVSPHYVSEEAGIIEDFKQKLNYDILPLADGEVYEEVL